jgi:hypothetical protein
MSIPEGATNFCDNGLYYKKNESGEWFFYSAKNKWLKSDMKQEWIVRSSKVITTSRDEALEFLVKHLPTWPNNSFTTVLPHGWYWESYLGDTRLCHTVHDSIARENWENAKPSFTRDQMLERLVNECDEWFTEEQGSPGGWYVKKVGAIIGTTHPVFKFVVTKTGQNHIKREDWENAKQVKMLNDSGSTGEAWYIDQKYNIDRPCDNNDQVRKPNHYQMIDGVESIQVIACSLTRDEWRGFCLGNELKYRIRAGKKDALQQDIDKANEYGLLFEKHKELNRGER